MIRSVLFLCHFLFESEFTSYCNSRCLNGALNGNIGVMKSMTAEMTDSTNMARAWAFLPLAWSSGSTLGCVLPSFRFLDILKQPQATHRRTTCAACG